MSVPGPQNARHSSVTSPICPKCRRHSLRELENNNYACQNCRMRFSKEQVIFVERKKGSGVIAPPAYRYGYANWTRGSRR